MLETQEMQVRSLGWEDLLEGEMATHFSILAWIIPQTEKPGGPQSIGSQIGTQKMCFLGLVFDISSLTCTIFFFIFPLK